MKTLFVLVSMVTFTFTHSMEPPKIKADKVTLIDEVQFARLYKYCIERKEEGWFGDCTVSNSFFCDMPIDIRKMVWRYVTFDMCQKMIKRFGPTHCLIEFINAYHPHPFDNHCGDLVKEGRTFSVDHRYLTASLYWATVTNNAEEIEKLLLRGYSVNGEGQQYNCATPLHCAAWFNCQDAARKLLAYHAMVDSETPIGRTPLFYAVMARHEEMVEILLKSGANPYKSDFIFSLSPIDCAKNYPKIKAMLEAAMAKPKPDCVII